MASSGEVVIIFADTNIGTHIALAVSPDITAANFKKSLPAILYAFQGFKGTWFLHVEVQPSNNLVKSAKTHNHVSDDSRLTHTQLEKPLKGKRDDNYSNMEAYPGNSDNKRERRAAVGRRILIAANNIKHSGKKKRPAISFYRFIAATNVPSVSRISAFEMSD